MTRLHSQRAQKNRILKEETRSFLEETLFIGVTPEKRVEIENDVQLLVRFALKQIIELQAEIEKLKNKPK